jgi:hypothetical protein
METKKVARLVQPNGSNCADHSQVPRASGKARSVRTARATRHGSAVVAVACSLAVVATSIAPMAAASSLRRERSTVANNAVDPQLARLHETRGVGLGIVLGTENFLRVSPVTAVAKNDGPVATDNGVDAQLAARKSATVRAGDKVSRALSQVVAEEEHLGHERSRLRTRLCGSSSHLVPGELRRRRERFGNIACVPCLRKPSHSTKEAR